jgi:LAGLIDADG DNA endonuclease family protein
MELATDVLDPWFVTGLVEGEGCFTVSFTFRDKLRVGIETRPSFSISLNERDLGLIQSVHAFFRCGAIRYSRGDRTYKFESRSACDLVSNVIPHFQRFPLHGRKAKDFEIFLGICRLIDANLHMNREHLRVIIEDAYRMNPSGKRRHDRAALLRQLDELKV